MSQNEAVSVWSVSSDTGAKITIRSNLLPALGFFSCNARQKKKKTRLPGPTFLFWSQNVNSDGFQTEANIVISEYLNT